MIKIGQTLNKYDKNASIKLIPMYYIKINNIINFYFIYISKIT